MNNGLLGIQTPWGVPIVGMTEEKFLTALAIILGYFCLRLFGLIFFSILSEINEIMQARNSREYEKQKDIKESRRDPHWQPLPPDKREAHYRRLDSNYEKKLQSISDILYYIVPVFLPFGAGGYSFYLLLNQLGVFS